MGRGNQLGLFHLRYEKGLHLHRKKEKIIGVYFPSKA